MKRLIVIIAFSIAITSMIFAQFEQDVLLTSRNVLTGNARSMSLSNAMGAMGGDISALSINPAGIAIYQSSEFTFSQGLNFSGTTSNYEGTERTDNLTTVPFQSIGFVATYKPMRQTGKGFVSSHLGFSYNRINSFNQNITLEGRNINSSMLDDFRVKADGLTPADLEDPNYEEYYSSYLAYYAYLLEPLESGEYYHAFEDDNTTSIDWRPLDGINQKQFIDTRGYTGEYSLTGGMNLSNQFYFGVSLNFQNLNYERSTSYREVPQGLAVANNPVLIEGENLDVVYFDYETHRKLDGNSFNAKLGFIYKPIHQIRLGVSYQSPNYFNIKQSYYTYLKAGYSDNTSIDITSNTAEYDYNFQSPSKLTGSIGVLIGKIGFISADYEYQNVANSKFKSSERNINYDDEFQALNNSVSSHFKATHSTRIGIEIKAQPFLMFRVGGGYYTSPQTEGYRQTVKANDLYTGSLGFGYRNKLFFLDVGYMAIMQDYDYLPYNYNDLDYGNEPVNITSLDNRFAVTCGWKF